MSTYTQFDPANPPPPLMISEPNSFAYWTMTTRFPAIIQKVMADHSGLYPSSIVKSLQELQEELVQNQPVRPLQTDAPDGEEWAIVWQSFQGRRWLELPWYAAEAFFYRRLLEAANYFGGNDEALAWVGVDPFLPGKQAELSSPTTWQALAAALAHAPDGSADSFRALLHHCVWGNRADLSYTKVKEAAQGQMSVAHEQENLLVDDTEAVLEYLHRGTEAEESKQLAVTNRELYPVSRLPSPAGGRIDFICDNAGLELLLDLALTDFFLSHGWAEQVTLHLKAQPTYVSDATLADVDMSLTAMQSGQGATVGATAELLIAVAQRLQSYRTEQRLQLQPHVFWNSSRFFWDIPPALQTELTQADLVIIKGDANYRRLVGDHRWPTTTQVAAAVPYFPAPWVSLRTLKSDPIVGLPPGLAQQLDQADPEWRVNGKRGIIQVLL